MSQNNNDIRPPYDVRSPNGAYRVTERKSWTRYVFPAVLGLVAVLALVTWLGWRGDGATTASAAELGRAISDGSAVDQRYRVDGLAVLRAPGDYVFWISLPGREVPVVLDDELRGRQPEDRVDVRQAQRVNLVATGRRVADASAETLRLLEGTDREQFQRAGVYLSASDVRIVAVPPGTAR